MHSLGFHTCKHFSHPLWVIMKCFFLQYSSSYVTHILNLQQNVMTVSLKPILTDNSHTIFLLLFPTLMINPVKPLVRANLSRNQKID